MVLLDGATLSQKILSSLKLKIKNLQKELNLHIILVGNDPNSLKYVNMKMKRCQEIGVNCIVHHLGEDTSEADLENLIINLNTDQKVDGFFIQLPLPSSINKQKMLSLIEPQKDVDGLSPDSTFLPAVVKGVIKLLEDYQLIQSGMSALVINDSDLIGKPLCHILKDRHLKVEMANKFTNNLQGAARNADLLISATGINNLITPDYVKQGAIVVDVGGGDIDFKNVAPVCSYITPTTGGVGPMTIACLLENLVTG